MNKEILRQRISEPEWKWFIGAGVVVGILFNLAFKSNPFDPGGLTGGLLSAILIYLMG
jgi:hypothetical protein